MKRTIALILCVLLAISTLSIGIFADEQETPPQPDIPVLSTRYGVTILDPAISAEQVTAGDAFVVQFRLDGNCNDTWTYSNGFTAYTANRWDDTAKTIVTVSGSAGFTLEGSLAEINVNNGLNTVSILTDDTLATGRYQVTINVTCVSKNGATASDSRTFNINVEASTIELEEELIPAKFVMTGASIPEGIGRSNLKTNIDLTFLNTSEVDAEEVSVSISGLGSILLDTFTDIVELGTIRSGEMVKASFPVKFPEYPTVQSTAMATLKFKDSEGNEYTDSFNIYIQAKENEKPEEVTRPEVASLTPKVIVSNYDTDVEKIVSGEEFELTFVLKNTSLDKDIMNMTVDVIPGSDGSSGSTGTVFSPIDGTTSFYTKCLEKDGEMEYVIRLKTSASAGARSYPITVRFNFEYENGTMYSTGNGSMDINLPVSQPIKFDLVDWLPPTECPITGTILNFQYFNKAKTPMTNLAVSVEGDFSMPTQYVGTLNASNSDFFTGMITPIDPTAIGEVKTAILVFTFEDASSNEQRVEYPFEMLITEEEPDLGFGDGMLDPGFMDPDFGFGDENIPADGDGVKSEMSIWTKGIIFIGIPIVLLIIIAIVISAVKKRNEKLYEDEDED